MAWSLSSLGIKWVFKDWKSQGGFLEESLFHMGLQQAHCPDFVKRKKYIQGKMLTSCHQPPNSVPINDSVCKQTAKVLTENSLGNLF